MILQEFVQPLTEGATFTVTLTLDGGSTQSIGVQVTAKRHRDHRRAAAGRARCDDMYHCRCNSSVENEPRPLFGEVHIQLVDGEQTFVASIATGTVSGTVTVTLS